MSRTYRILIVEDEEIECNALKMMLKYNRQDVEQIQTASNGVHALAQYQEFHPDIVFMDINLPGINGLDVIRQMRQLPGTPYFVIISAHSQFSYAQEAMRLDVQDFLVKPIRLEDINKVLDGLVHEIEQTLSQKERIQHQQAKLDAIRPVLESDCVLSIGSMRSNVPIATIFDFMEIKVNSGFVFTLRGEGVGSLLLREVKSKMRDMGLYCIGEMLYEVCVCVALSEDTIRPPQVQEIMAHLSSSLKAAGQMCQIGVGSVAGSADGLRRSYEQSMSANKGVTITEPTLSFFSNLNAPEENTLSYVTDVAGKITQSIRTGATEAVISQLKSFFNSYPSSVSFRRMREAAYWLYIMVIGNFSEQASAIKPLSAVELFAMQDMKALHESLQKSFLALTNIPNGDSNLQPNQIVRNAIQIVKSRFQEDITLDNVAEELNVSPFYLSKLFRKHTGTNFTDYLTQTRVKRSQKLLEAGQLSVKEVAYAVGFNSQSYFSKVFKKYTGTVPSDYKGQIAAEI